MPLSLAEKVVKIKHELGLDDGMAMSAALQSANEMMGLRPANYTLPEQADLVLSVSGPEAPPDGGRRQLTPGR